MSLGTPVILAAVSFLITLGVLPTWIKRARATGFVGRDVHKNGKETPEMGGLAVILGVVIALTFYIGLMVFAYGGNSLLFLLAAMCTILIAAMIGMTDDMLGWRIGLSQREKVLLTFLVPIPLMAVNAGHSEMTIPLLGKIDVGLVYPLLIVPLGVIGATNGFNMLAGYNGLEAGTAVVILSALGFLAVETGDLPAAVIAFSFVGAMLAFLLFNRYPSKVFPGDVLTYPVGAAIATVAILGNIERFAAMLFALYFLELGLKARGSFRPEWPAELLEDGSLGVRERMYSVPHLFIAGLIRLKGKAWEYEVVASILAAQVLIALLVVGSFYRLV